MKKILILFLLITGCRTLSCKWYPESSRINISPSKKIKEGLLKDDSLKLMEIEKAWEEFDTIKYEGKPKSEIE